MAEVDQPGHPSHPERISRMPTGKAGGELQISLESIHVDPERMPIRSQVHHRHVRQLAARVTEGIALPPVLLWRDGDRLLLLSGVHRVEAYRLAERSHIPAVVTESSREDAAARAYAELATPGRRASAWERARALRTLHCEVGEPSIREMERLTGVGRSQIQQLLKVGRDLAESIPSDLMDSHGHGLGTLHELPLRTLYHIASEGETPGDRTALLRAELERRSHPIRAQRWWLQIAHVVGTWLRAILARAVQIVRSGRTPDTQTSESGPRSPGIDHTNNKFGVLDEAGHSARRPEHHSGPEGHVK